MKNWNPKCKCGETDKKMFHKNQSRCKACFKSRAKGKEIYYTEDMREWHREYAQGFRDSNPDSYKEYYEKKLVNGVFTVYRLVSDKTDMVYIGYTNFNLTHRYNVHKATVKRSIKICSPNALSRGISSIGLEFKDFHIEELSVFDTKYEAKMYESFLISDMMKQERALNITR